MKFNYWLAIDDLDAMLDDNSTIDSNFIKMIKKLEDRGYYTDWFIEWTIL